MYQKFIDKYKYKIYFQPKRSYFTEFTILCKRYMMVTFDYTAKIAVLRL